MLLPHLLHTSLLALLSASIPLSTILTSTLVAMPSSHSTKPSSPLISPTANELLRANPVGSVHVFAFSSDGSVLLNESDGKFSYEEWDEAAEAAEGVCCKEEGGVGLGEGMEVDGKEGSNLEEWLREIVKEKVAREQKWKNSR